MDRTKELFRLLREADALNPDLRSNAEIELEQLQYLNVERPHITNNPKPKNNVKQSKQ